MKVLKKIAEGVMCVVMAGSFGLWGIGMLKFMVGKSLWIGVPVALIVAGWCVELSVAMVREVLT